MKLTERSALMGVFNIRVEVHGDEEKPAIDIPLTEVGLEPDEIDALIGVGASAAFFADDEQPRFPGIKPVELEAKVEGVHVTLWLGSGKKPLFERACDLKGLRIAFDHGFVGFLSCKVQLSEPGDEVVEKLAGALNTRVRIAFAPVQEDIVEAAAKAA